MLDYVDWVEKVMLAVAHAWKQSDASTRMIGITMSAIVHALGFKVDTRKSSFDRTKLAEAVRDALRDLDQMGLVENSYSHSYKLTSEGNKFPDATLTTVWPQIIDIYLDPEQHEFLSVIVRMGQEMHQQYVCVKDLTGQQVSANLGWSWNPEATSKCFLFAQQLSELMMLHQSPRGGGYIEVFPTYMGIVRITRQIETALGKLIRECLEEWETSNVEFKRELNVARDKEKAEFIRDILGLATTKSSGRRFFIIGFEDDRHQFYQSVDPNITQERLEQILNAYCEPIPQIRYTRVPWSGGEVGLVEAIRNLKMVPYRVKKDLGGKHGIHRGDIYVRHGSHTEPPTAREEQELLAEGQAKT